MKVFISHTFAEDDQELSSILQSVLSEKNIEGYLAEKRKEYDLLIRDKIRNEIENSDYIVGIVTNKAKESASVNQELGYALRAGVRVIIMLEKNAKNGVLTHGIEPEEFTRDNFKSSCVNVRNHITEKGIRKKISDEDKKALIDNVYQQLYDQMMGNYQSRNFITFIPDNPWEKISPSWKLKTEDYIKQLCENYSKELKIWHEMWIIDFGNKFTSNRDKLGNLLSPVFEKHGLLDQSGNVKYGNYSHPPKEWLHNVQYVIFNDKIQDGDELYRIFKDETRRQYGEEYSQHLDEWHNNKPEFFTDLLKIIPDLVKGLNTKHSYAEIDKQREILRKSIEALTVALEEKLK